MNILGLSTFADSSAAVVADGKIICAVEEERLNRVKHYEGMPLQAICECLSIANMSLSDIDVIALGWNPLLGWKTRLFETAKSAIRSPAALGGKISRGGNYINGCKEIFALKKSLAMMFPRARVPRKMIFIEHHFAHAASTFLISPYEKVNIIVADGTGESTSISFFTGEGKLMKQMGRIRFPHSLGHLYASVTGFLGFRITHDEGKVMALAGFGEDRFRDLFGKLVRVDKKHKTIKLNNMLLDYHAVRNGIFFKEWLKQTQMTPRKKEEPLNQQHKDLACSLQKCIEETVLTLLQMHFTNENRRPLCAAGGLFLNSVLNGEITRSYNDNFFIQPAAGDNGVSLGAALCVSSRMEDNYQRLPLANVYLGRNYTGEEIKQVLKNYSINPRKSDDIFAETADLIAGGRIVGWFRGRMEFGPRALGNRSILACPTESRMKNMVNLKVKHREEFRPFAGSVVLEEARNYLEGAQESPFMLKVFCFKGKYQSLFFAIRHIDGTCRVQTVSKMQNPDFYRLLMEVKKRISHPVVLNTSMNTAGEPIVNTPQEAINLLKRTDLDVLILENYLIRKQDITI